MYLFCLSFFIKHIFVVVKPINIFFHIIGQHGCKQIIGLFEFWETQETASYPAPCHLGSEGWEPLIWKPFWFLIFQQVVGNLNISQTPAFQRFDRSHEIFFKNFGYLRWRLSLVHDLLISNPVPSLTTPSLLYLCHFFQNAIPNLLLKPELKLSSLRLHLIILDSLLLVFNHIHLYFLLLYILRLFLCVYY